MAVMRKLNRYAVQSVMLVAVAVLFSAMPAMARTPAQTVPAKYDQPKQIPHAFIFSDAVDAPYSCRQRFTYWTDDERRQLNKVLATVMATHPKVLRAALQIGDIHLYRLRDTEKNVTAETGDGGLAFHRGFFRASLRTQYHVLLHELGHWCDGGRRISYSRRWIQFAHPAIAKVQCIEALYGEKEAERHLRTSMHWRMYHAATNLQESVAESYANAAYGYDGDHKLDRMHLYILDAVENMTPEQAAYAGHFKRAMVAQDEKRDNEAIRGLLRALQADPTQPAAHALLIQAYRSNCEYGNADCERAEAERAYANVAAPRHDAMRIWSQAKMSPHAVGITECLDVLAKRQWYDQQGNYRSNSLKSLVYLFNGGATGIAQALLLHEDKVAPTLKKLINSDADPKFVEALLARYVTEKSQSPDALRLRAMWFEAQGDDTAPPAERTRYYALARADFDSASHKLPDSNRVQAALVNILIKTHKLAAAQQLQSTLEKRFGMTLALRASRINLLEANHKTDEAQQELERLISDFRPREQHTRPSDVARPPDDLS